MYCALPEADQFRARSVVLSTLPTVWSVEFENAEWQTIRCVSFHSTVCDRHIYLCTRQHFVALGEVPLGCGAQGSYGMYYVWY